MKTSKKVTPGYSSYMELLYDTLTVGEISQLIDSLGWSKKQFNYNMNRPTKLTREQVEAIAEKVHHDKNFAIDMVTIYGLGKEKITLSEAEEMRTSKDKK